VIEVAKWRFLQGHVGRERPPRGFTDGIELKLTGVEDGSAIPVITLFLTSLNLPGPGMAPSNQVYFEEARESIIGAIDAAEHGQSVAPHLPEECLGYFDRIGRSLRDGESIEFTSPLHASPARLNKETRRKLVLASSRVQELTEEVSLRGSIPAADQDKMTFELQLIGGHKVGGPVSSQHFDTIIEAFNQYRNGMRVHIQGIGRYNRQQRLLALESVEHISLLDSLDVPARLDELRGLKDGWLEGVGTAPSADGLDWFTGVFERFFPEELPLPHVYPTEEGGVQAEWSLGSNEISLEVDLNGHRGEWHLLNLADNSTKSLDLNLDDENGWAQVVADLRKTVGDAK